MDRFIVFLPDRFRHVEKQGGFSRAGRRNDQAALATANGGHDIDDAGCETLGRGFETDPARRSAAWLAVATATLADGSMPGDLLNELIATANTDPALLSGMQKMYASKAATDGKPMTLGLAIARSLHQTAGNDATKLDAARDQYIACMRDYGMVSPEFFVWGVQWLRELLWHEHFTGDSVESACNKILAKPFEVEYMRRAFPARYGDLYNLKKIGERFPALQKLADTEPSGVDGEMYLAYVGASGNTEKQAKILFEYTTEKTAGLSKDAAHWARGSALYLAERCNLRDQTPAWAQRFWQTSKHPAWANQYLWRVRIFSAKDLQADAAAVARASWAIGTPAESASIVINGASAVRMEGHPEEAWAVLNKTFGPDYTSWSWEALAQGITAAAAAKDLPGYEKIFQASVARDGGQTFQGLVGWHGLTDEPLRTKLLTELTKSPDPALTVWVLSWVAERQRAEDFPGFLASYKAMRERSSKPSERLEFVITLGWEGALARKDRAVMKSFATDLRRSIELAGMLSDWNRFGQMLQQVVESGVMTDGMDPAAAAIERRVWLELLLKNGGCSNWTTWAARSIAEDQRPTDPVAAAITMQLLVRSGWRDNPGDFDRVLAEIIIERDAGRIGVAAGAFAHMAKWFNPDRVSPERIQNAQRLASDCQARLGSLQDIDARDPRAPLLRAGALLAAGDEIEAYRLAKANEKLLEANLASVPSDLVLLVARNRIREERYVDARALLLAFSRTLNESPASADAAARARFQIGEAFYFEGNHQAAQTEYQTVIATWPKLPQTSEAQLRLGDCAYAQRQVPQARAAFEQLLMADDKLVRIKARYRLALLASAEGQKDEAFKMFRELAIENPPKEVANELYLDWGKQLINANRLKEAEDVLALVGRSNNRDPVAPGDPLCITLQDTYLQASNNHASVPVQIKTASGDQERCTQARAESPPAAGPDPGTPPELNAYSQRRTRAL